jgi:hypothetical protein
MLSKKSIAQDGYIYQQNSWKELPRRLWHMVFSFARIVCLFAYPCGSVKGRVVGSTQGPAGLLP